MKQDEKSTSKRRVFKPKHEVPKDPFLDYIILPYGEFYKDTKGFLEAKTGDILRFFNGPEFEIESVMKIRCDRLCDMLCRMRYGVSWNAVLARWQRYATLDGSGKQIISTEECIMVVYGKEKTGVEG